MKRRSRVNKRNSARKFRKATMRTRGANIWTNPMRGGIRL